MSILLQQKIIASAAQMLADRSKWTRYTTARDRAGRACSPLSTGATRFCAYGALLRSAYDLVGKRDAASSLALSCEKMISPGRLAITNDQKGRREVLRLLRRGPIARPPAAG